jgi:hypothetical protein
MSDARVQYIQERLEAGLDGFSPTPSVASFLDQAKNKQVSPRPPEASRLDLQLLPRRSQRRAPGARACDRRGLGPTRCAWALTSRAAWAGPARLFQRRAGQHQQARLLLPGSAHVFPLVRHHSNSGMMSLVTDAPVH